MGKLAKVMIKVDCFLSKHVATEKKPVTWGEIFAGVDSHFASARVMASSLRWERVKKLSDRGLDVPNLLKFLSHRRSIEE